MATAHSKPGSADLDEESKRPSGAVGHDSAVDVAECGAEWDGRVEDGYPQPLLVTRIVADEHGRDGGVRRLTHTTSYRIICTHR